MQAASPAAPKRRLRYRARLLVQGIDAAPAAAQTETGFDAGRVAPRVQADHQSAVIVDATASVNNSGCDCTRITSASPNYPTLLVCVGTSRLCQSTKSLCDSGGCGASLVVFPGEKLFGGSG